MQIKRFEDIQAWQQARKLAQDIYALTSRGAWAKDFALRDQIRRAAISVLSNVAEGFERRGDTEFMHFLSIAKGSASEIKAQLYIALDQGYIDKRTFDSVYEIADKACHLLGGFINYLETSRVGRRKTGDGGRKTEDA